MISYCFYIVFAKNRYFNVYLKMEKIFIKIQNSFSKYVEGLLTPYLFSFEILHHGGKLENRSFRKKLTPNLTGSAGSNSGFHTSIDDPCVTHETVVGHDIVTGIVIDEISFLRTHGPAGNHRGSRRSCTAGAVILFGMSDQTFCVHP